MIDKDKLRIAELRGLLDQAHDVMQVQVVGLRRLKAERDEADRLTASVYKALGPVVSALPEEGSENIAVRFAYAALEQHTKKVEARKRG